MSNTTRREFLSTAGALGAIAASIPVLSVAQADEAPAAQPPARATGRANEKFIEFGRDELTALVQDCPIATEDLVLPDGTVIDKEYVTLYNRLNRLGQGLNGTPGVGSFDLLMRFWSLEDARNYNAMPMLEYFTAYDYAMKTGLSEEEAHDILDELTAKKLIFHANRVGIDWYSLIPYAGGIRATIYREFDKDVLSEGDTLRGVDGDMTSQYPIFHACPVSPDVTEDGTILPYRDWRAVIERNTIFGVHPCGCRNDAMLRATMEPKDEGIMHCMTFGEFAQFGIETGNDVQITKEECLAEVEKLIDLGYVPEMAFAENPEVLCLCKAERCAMLTTYRALNGQAKIFPKASAYVLDYDRDACVRCGACIDRCPMQSVSWDDEGLCVMDNACVACGQCALVCPASARLLKPKPAEEITALPSDLLEQTIWCSADRMASNNIVDFVDTELPAYAVEISEAAKTAASNDLIVDTRPTGAATNYTDGTYNASSNGIQGPVEVTVEIAGGKIAHVSVGENSETPGIGSLAIEQLPDEIVTANGLDVDVAASATHTSVAILRAVEDCLHQAGMPK